MGKRHDYRYKHIDGMVFISKEKRLELFNGSDKICRVCKTILNIDSARYDHCHNDGGFRGWLCHHCNTAIGFMKDNPELLRNAAQYLEDYDGN